MGYPGSANGPRTGSRTSAFAGCSRTVSAISAPEGAEMSRQTVSFGRGSDRPSESARVHHCLWAHLPSGQVVQRNGSSRALSGLSGARKPERLDRTRAFGLETPFPGENPRTPRAGRCPPRTPSWGGEPPKPPPSSVPLLPVLTVLALFMPFLTVKTVKKGEKGPQNRQNWSRGILLALVLSSPFRRLRAMGGGEPPPPPARRGYTPPPYPPRCTPYPLGTWHTVTV